MIKSERNGSKTTIKFDHYTIVVDDYHAIESLSISDDRDKEDLDREKMAVREVMNGTRSVSSLNFAPVSEYIVEAISEYNKQFVVFSNKRNERILVDYKNPNNCKYVESDNNGSIELRCLNGLAFAARYSEKKVEEEEDILVLREGEPSFIKKEVFIILNDRILMYHLPFMGKVVEYMLNDDASSNQIHICVDYARIKGSILQQTYNGLSLDDKPLPVKAGYECKLIAKLDHTTYDCMNQVVIEGSDSSEIFIDTYGQTASFVYSDDTRNPYWVKLRDICNKEILDFKVGDDFDHNRFFYQTAN